MAKRGRKADNKGLNKSQAIRDFMAKNPSATPKLIREGLLEQGVDASVGLISAVKYGGKNASGRGVRLRRVRKMGRRGASGDGLMGEDLVLAKQFAERVGGIEQARAALEMLEQLA